MTNESIADMLARLRKVCADATPGPWQTRFIYRTFKRVRESPGDLLIGDPPEHDWPNAEFMCESRAVLPAALDCVAALERTRCECDLVPDECDRCAALAAFRKAGER